MRLFKKKSFSNTQVLNKIKSKTNASRHILFYQGYVKEGYRPDYSVNITYYKDYFLGSKFYPINGLKSSYVINETIDFHYIYECTTYDDYHFRISMDDTFGHLYGQYENECFKNPTKWNLTYYDSDFENGSYHTFVYMTVDSYYRYPFIISDRHSPDIKLSDENVENFVKAGEDLVIHGQIRNLDGSLNACLFTRLNRNNTKQHQCITADDSEWHDFTVRVETKNLIKFMHRVDIYAIQESDDYRSNIIHHYFMISSKAGLEAETCDYNYDAKNRLNNGSLMPSLLMGGLSSYFG